MKYDQPDFCSHPFAEFQILQVEMILIRAGPSGLSTEFLYQQGHDEGLKEENVFPGAFF
jgi:hypothetical protein